MTRVRVEFPDHAAFDSLDRLPQPDQDVAWDLLEHLSANPRYGKELRDHPVAGRLGGTRSIYVIDFDEQVVSWPPAYRIVYRLLPNEAAPDTAQVIHVGPRDELEVYKVAARRLRRASE